MKPHSIALLWLAFAGCLARKEYIAADFTFPERVAVLPMANETTDLDGPVFVRQLIFEKLQRKGYHVIPLAEVDAKLHAHGFTEGGQLGAASPAQLGQWLGVDALFYGNLIQFNYINLGYYWQRKVTVWGRLVDVSNARELWERERTWMTLNVETKHPEAAKTFLAQLGVKAMEKTLHTPLYAESQIAVERLLDTLPSR